MQVSPRENDFFPKKLEADPRGRNPLPSVDYRQHSNILTFESRKSNSPKRSNLPIQRPTTKNDEGGAVAVPKSTTQIPQSSPMPWIAPLVVQGFIALAVFVGIYFLNAINASVSEVRSEMNSNAAELRTNIGKLSEKMETSNHELVGAINSVSEKQGVTNAKLEMLIGEFRPDHKQ
jgi:hypothetical protein